MEQTQLQTVWAQILEKTQESLAKPACEKWIVPLRPLSLDDTTLVLGSKNDFTRDWINDHYLTILRDATTAIVGSSHQVHIETLPEAKDTADTEPEQLTLMDAAPAQAETVAESQAAAPQPETQETQQKWPQVIAPGDNSSLNTRYTFETFVTGNSNQLAHAAAQAVAKAPGKVYNPLFMYGGVGLGKTHLMHAIGNRVLQNHPERRVLYVSSEKFMNELIDAIRSGHTERFRAKYRKIDVLMIDDIQFLSGKESTQMEFFNTFNELKDAEKALVISSDRPPKELATLHERLRSRFAGGLIADIQPPDFEMRIGILRNKAQMEHYSVPNAVLEYIANHIDSNIRELEGALTRVVAYASLMNKDITQELAAETLKDILPKDRKKAVTIELIQDVVADYFKVKIDDLHSKKRNRNIAYPRQIAMYLCRELTDTSLPQIGNFFGGRDHTTVIHACDKIGTDRQTDTKLEHTLKKLSEQIQKI